MLTPQKNDLVNASKEGRVFKIPKPDILSTDTFYFAFIQTHKFTG